MAHFRPPNNASLSRTLFSCSSAGLHFTLGKICLVVFCLALVYMVVSENASSPMAMPPTSELDDVHNPNVTAVARNVTKALNETSLRQLIAVCRNESEEVRDETEMTGREHKERPAFVVDHLCGKRWPGGPSLPVERLESVRGLRYFIVSCLHGSEEILHNHLSQILRLLQWLGPSNSYLSIYEGGSEDKTNQWLELFDQTLDQVLPELRHTIVVNGDVSIWRPGRAENRIQFLSRLRNAAMQPLWREASLGRKYDKVVFINDVLYCMEDVQRLIALDTDVACGLDYDFWQRDGRSERKFYDSWVARDRDGRQFGPLPPHFVDPHDQARFSRGLPVAASCCWNGMFVATTDPFYNGVEFRTGKAGECAGSECSQVCKDFWAHNKTRFAVDPYVQLTYHLDEWLRLTRFVDVPPLPELQDQQMHDIRYLTAAPPCTWCCGLRGFGRHPDQPCIWEASSSASAPLCQQRRV